jgi:hypothetical protein
MVFRSIKILAGMVMDAIGKGIGPAHTKTVVREIFSLIYRPFRIIFAFRGLIFVLVPRPWF